MFKKITFFGALLALVVIIFGAYVRLSNAGLGCPDWPGCYGQAIVDDSAQFKNAAELSFPAAPLDTGKAWKEMTHRYLAGGLGLIVLALLPLGWGQPAQRKLAISLLLLVVAQAALGMWTVNLKVMPIVVTAHMLLGFMTFWLLSWTYLRGQVDSVPRLISAGPVWFTRFAILILILQIVLGGWVSSNYAALACSDFPRCNGSWWPTADYEGALNLLHGLVVGDASILDSAAQLAAHTLHRLGAAVSFILLFLLMLVATDQKYPPAVRRSGTLLSVLLLLQIVLGILNIKYSLPLWTAIAHNAFAALLMLPLLGIYFYSKYSLPATEVQTPLAEQLLDESIAQPLETIVSAENFTAVEPESLFLRLKTQLKKTRGGLGAVLNSLAFGQNAVTRDLLEEVETSLLTADIGMETTNNIIKKLTESLERDQLKDGAALSLALKQNLYEMLQPSSLPLQIPKQDNPFVILVVGVNGAGKTTSIGKLAHRLQAQGHSVMLAAGDTFRAAAVEQLQTWGERNNVQVVAQQSGADSASVIFDALQSAKAKGIDVLIADTAGRLHTKSNLMEELKKIKRIMGKLDADAPHEVLLILDAGTGQNALSQARLFNEAVNLTGIALTKLDGTAKGGVIFALANQLGLPIRFIGVGEAIEDLQDFDAQTFVDALFVKD
ncbi:signal recognition particle-docking protein FtsY [Methylomonas sp. AM2-LC]|uniref:signal recognition particle-docking protein FtsY n=1 Tax=Methylomonas sp. AM2-LC TaxID=3153301 RepID=UPI003267875D